LKISKIFNSTHIRVSAIGSLGIKFFSALFAFLNGILLARLLSVSDFGIYVIAFTTLTVLTVPVSLGLPNLITRYISKYQVYDDKASIKGLLIKTNIFVAISCLLVYVIAFASYFFWWKKFDFIFSETFIYALIGLPFIALGSLRSAALRGLKYVVLGQLPDTFLRNFLFFLGIILFALLGYKLSPQSAMLLLTIATIVSFFVGYYFLKIKLLNDLKHIKPVFKSREWLKESIPFTLTSGIEVVKSKSLTYILAIFGSVEAVAIFEIAMRSSTLISFTLDGLNSAIAPYISSAFEKKKMENLQRIVTKTTRIVFVFALPVALIFMIGGRPLLDFLYGKEYSIAYWPLVILCLGHLVNAFTGSAGIVLNMTGHQGYLSKSLAVMMVLMLLSSVPLVIGHDVVGASIAVSAIFILQNVLWVLYIRKNLRINTTIL
jgi:O-antigen/teichoic acid export membrane protein